MEHESSNIPLSKQVFSIPNLIGYFRIILIPIIVWNYINAQTASDYYFVTLLVAVSGISDALDGLIARHFNMITPLGKALDPIADKLTQGALAICLITKYPFMIVLFILFLIKETFMGITGILFLRRKEVADKLTQGALAICLITKYPFMIVLFILFLIKETFMGITGILFLRRKEVYGALWFGKVCTSVLYAVMIILIFFPEIPPTVANTFILISILFMLYSLIRYAMVNIKKLCRHTERKGRP